MTTAPAGPFRPARVNVLVPGVDAFLTTLAAIVRSHTGADDVQLSYEAAAGPLRHGTDPRGPEDAVRWVVAARFGSAWRVGSSAPLPYAADELEHEDAMIAAAGALVDELGAPAGTILHR